MFRSIFITLFLASSISSVVSAETTTDDSSQKPKQWALLIAGSMGWDPNYAAQAAVSHAYQTLRRHGMPPENIVVMMYDDIASDPSNPWPGKLINRIGGPDVYRGVVKDYTKDTVTPQNFLKVLRGDKMTVGSKKTINSGPNDHIFVFFTDHGGSGVLCFPEDELTVKDFLATLKHMHTARRYSKMVFFVEACESGSMFDGVIPKGWNIYAQTAANANEPAYFCQLHPQLNTFVNSEFSLRWKIVADTTNLNKETIDKEFKVSKNETLQSHVSEYGQLEIGKLPLADFLGEHSTAPIHYPEVKCNDGSRVPMNDAPYALLKRRAELSKSADDITKLRKADESFGGRNHVSLATKLLSKRGPIHDPDCHDVLIKTFSKNCYSFAKNPYLLRYANMMTNLCDESLGEVAVKVFTHSCSQMNKLKNLI